MPDELEGQIRVLLGNKSTFTVDPRALAQEVNAELNVIRVKAEKDSAERLEAIRQQAKKTQESRTWEIKHMYRMKVADGERTMDMLRGAVREFTEAAEDMRASGRVRGLQKTVDVLTRKVKDFPYAKEPEALEKAFLTVLRAREQRRHAWAEACTDSARQATRDLVQRCETDVKAMAARHDAHVKKREEVLSSFVDLAKRRLELLGDVEKTYQRTYLQIVKFHEIAKQVELQRKPDPNTAVEDVSARSVATQRQFLGRLNECVQEAVSKNKDLPDVPDDAKLRDALLAPVKIQHELVADLVSSLRGMMENEAQVQHEHVSGGLGQYKQALDKKLSTLKQMREAEAQLRREQLDWTLVRWKEALADDVEKARLEEQAAEKTAVEFQGRLKTFISEACDSARQFERLEYGFELGRMASQLLHAVRASPMTGEINAEEQEAEDATFKRLVEELDRHQVSGTEKLDVLGRLAEGLTLDQVHSRGIAPALAVLHREIDKRTREVHLRFAALRSQMPAMETAPLEVRYGSEMATRSADKFR